jgi:hypothetical protein
MAALHKQSARFNRFAIGILLGFYMAFILVSLSLGKPPFDYFIVATGAADYCVNNSEFQYGTVAGNQGNFYPAPFYIALCLPVLYAEPLLRFLFVMLPLVLALKITNWRALSLVFPPLISMVMLGQNSWMLLPLFIAAHQTENDDQVAWWYGLVFVLASFKPHIALPAGLWLLSKWWKQPQVLLTAAVGWLLLAIPAFVLRPTWLQEWLGNYGAYRQQVTSMALFLVRGGFADNRPVVLMFSVVVGALLYAILKIRRKQLQFYDWALIYFFSSPFVIYYDMVLLLPFIAVSRRRFYLAMTAGIVALLYAAMTNLAWEMCIVITLALVFERVLRTEH